jgi:hypothetical protein
MGSTAGEVFSERLNACVHDVDTTDMQTFANRQVETKTPAPSVVV